MTNLQKSVLQKMWYLDINIVLISPLKFWDTQKSLIGEVLLNANMIISIKALWALIKITSVGQF